MFGLALAALIVFWTVKDTKPSGSAVFPVLYGALGASAVIWLLATYLRQPATKPSQPVGHIKAGHDIKAGDNIEASGNVEAGWGIEAGGDIRAAVGTPSSYGRAAVSPLEQWLEQRIEEAARHKRERVVLGSPAYRTAMNGWDFQNVNDLLENHPSLVTGYRGNPPGHLPGVEHEEAYYDRQLAWLTETLHKLRDGSTPAAIAGIPSETITPESIASELIAFVPVAGEMLQRNVAQADVDDWAGKVGVGIRARGPRGEEEMFRAEGHDLDPRMELQAKVARLQNHILPKVNAGEWT